MSRPDFHDLLRVTAFWTLTFGSAIVQAEEPVQMEASPPSEALSLVPGPLLSPEPNPTPLPDGTMPQPLPVMPKPVLPESKALSEQLDTEPVGLLQRFTPTIEALVTPDIDEALDEAPAKTAFWNAFKALGPWWAEQPP